MSGQDAGKDDAQALKAELKAKERASRQAANKAEREARREENKAKRQAQRKPAAPARTEAPKPRVKRKPAAPPPPAIQTRPFNILLVGQNGAIGRQAAIFAASLRRNSPQWQGRLIVAEPQNDGAWSGAQVRMSQPTRDALTAFGAEILPFTAQHFGRSYPYGNKIEALSVLPADEPFIFFDSDTLVTGPLESLALDFARPSASMRRTGTWPQPPLYGPGFSDIWKSLYDRFGLDFASTLDPSQPDEHWEHYLYFNAGWFFGADPAEFGRRFLAWARAVRDEPGDALACQSLDPWLDQVVLPLVIHSFGGGRPDAGLAGLEGAVTCHYRNLPLMYAREDEQVLDTYEAVTRDPAIAPLMQGDEEFRRVVTDQGGRDVIRPMFEAEIDAMPENLLRHRLRKEGWWF